MEFGRSPTHLKCLGALKLTGFSFYCNGAIYKSGTVNSKSFVGKVLLRIKWKFELTVYFKHGILGKL